MVGSDLALAIIIGSFIYIVLGRICGYELYKDEFIGFLIDEDIIKCPNDSVNNYEKNIRPKWFRNVSRIISILIWPVSLSIAAIVVIIISIYVIITSTIKFFTE